MEQKDKDKKESNTVSSDGISRRSFFKVTGGAILLLFGVGGVCQLLKTEDIIRPPGGQDEELFLSRCIKCNRCQTVCPTNAIGTVTLSESLIDARTPVMRFNLGYCDFCNKCVEVCPTGALQPFDEDTVKIGRAALDKETCLAWFSTSCEVCYDICPYEAIKLDEQNHPVIDEEKCNGCGLCENACPVLSLRTYKGGKEKAIIVKPIQEVLYEG